jgi:hypothetical protein
MVWLGASTESGLGMQGVYFLQPGFSKATLVQSTKAFVDGLFVARNGIVNDVESLIGASPPYEDRQFIPRS